MVSSSAQLPNVHLRKKWQPYVKTWFNQPARKQRRRLARQQKAARNGVRWGCSHTPSTYTLTPGAEAMQTAKTPLSCSSSSCSSSSSSCSSSSSSCCRSSSSCSSSSHAVGISPRVALSIGIAVDHRRRNRSQESLTANVNRLKLYLSKLVLFQRGAKAKKGLAGVPADTPKSQLTSVRQVAIAAALPIQKPRKKIRARVITEEEKKFRAYATLRKQLRDAKNVGKHAKKLAEAAEAEKK
ncbi:hypothetical protein Efla_002283 [Eimeria flavescens]